LNEVYKEVAPWGKPGYILFVQTFGDLVTFHPHIHALVGSSLYCDLRALQDTKRQRLATLTVLGIGSGIAEEQMND
jgi:hypothetical protein